MDSIPSIFDALGGPGRVAKLIGVKPSAASEMKRRRSIPVQYWPALVEASTLLGFDGLNYEALVNLHTEKVAQ